ncbi:MAG: hypothetical protein AAGH88_00725 [Planctomycetota bacterium]
MTTTTLPTPPSAATPALDPDASSPSTLPVVLVDSRPEPGLAVTQWQAESPLDRRAALVQGTRPAGDPQITLAIPHRLNDGQVHWQALLSGRLQDQTTERSVGEERTAILLNDAWAQQVDRALTPGQRNRMTDVQTMRELLEVLNRTLPDFESCGISSAVLDQRIDLGLSDTLSPARVLERVCSRFDLRCRTDITRTHSGERRVTRLLPADRGRPITLPWARGGVGRVALVRGETAPTRALRCIALGSPPRLEDTYTLTPAWDPALQSQPDLQYDPQTSTDFSRYARVFRGWVLNEDGAFSGPMYDANAAFYLPTGNPTPPLRLTDCLTTDATGQRLEPVVEYSVNTGVDWQPLSGDFDLMDDRAGVLVTEPTLAAGWVTAGKTGDLLLRVTATLVGDSPIQAERLIGNPFLGEPTTQASDFGDAYRYDRVAAGSLHDTAIQAGDLFANQRDDRAALGDTVLDEPSPIGVRADLRVELIGAWPALQPGDRVLDPVAQGIGLDETPVLLGGQPGRVQRIETRFAASGQPPRTLLWLA